MPPDDVTMMFEPRVRSASGGDFPSRDEVLAELQKLGFVFVSDLMWAIIYTVMKVARTNATVLVTGETGTGKGLIAKLVHALSRRAGRRPVTVDCTAITSSLAEEVLFGHARGAFTGAVADRMGKFEFASGDTIILDEIGDLPSDQQAKLLRVLQERTIERVGSNSEIDVDVRVIAVTNRNLDADVRAGRFRADLLYRLKVVTIVDPPLREHMEDLPVIAEHALRRHCLRHGRVIGAISPDAMKLLMNHNWPGNARELDAVMEGAVVIEDSDTITPSSLVFGPTGSQTMLAALDYVLRKPHAQAKEFLDLVYLISRYIEAGGNASEASRLSGAPRKLFSRLRKLLTRLGMNVDVGQRIDWLDLLRRLDELPTPDEENDDAGQNDERGTMSDERGTRNEE